MFQSIGEEQGGSKFELFPLPENLCEILNPRVKDRSRLFWALRVVDEVVGKNPAISRLNLLDLSEQRVNKAFESNAKKSNFTSWVTSAYLNDVYEFCTVEKLTLKTYQAMKVGSNAEKSLVSNLACFAPCCRQTPPPVCSEGRQMTSVPNMPGTFSVLSLISQ